MSDPGSGIPPMPPPENVPEGEWEPVTPPVGESYPPPPPGYTAPPNYPPPPPGYLPPQGQYPPPGYGAAPASLSSNAAAAWSYVTFIPAVIFLVIEPYRRDPFVKFHAWQCIVLTAISVASRFVFGLLGWIGWTLYSLFSLILFVFWLIAIIKASRGERYHIPVVGDVAENLARSV